MKDVLTLVELAERAGAPDTSTLRKDIKAGLLNAIKFGQTYVVEEEEGERWIREVWPDHQANRKKPIGSKRKPR